MNAVLGAMPSGGAGWHQMAWDGWWVPPLWLVGSSIISSPYSSLLSTVRVGSVHSSVCYSSENRVSLQPYPDQFITGNTETYCKMVWHRTHGFKSNLPWFQGELNVIFIRERNDSMTSHHHFLLGIWGRSVWVDFLRKKASTHLLFYEGSLISPNLPFLLDTM